MKWKDRVQKLKTEIPAIFLSLKDKDTPLLAKIVGGITVAYVLSPVDLIPDFIPVLGYLDDVILLPMLAAITIKLLPAHILERNRQRAQGLWEKGKPKRWYYGLPVLIVWGIVAFWVVGKIQR